MFGRLQIIIIGGIILLGALIGFYYSWRKGIEQEALLKYNQKQLEQTISDQAEFKRKVDIIQKEQDEILKNNKEAKAVFDGKIKAADDFLDAKETKVQDRPSSSILKNTINKLKDAPK